MKFLVDNSVSWRVAKALNDLGHEAVHVRDIGLAKGNDPSIFDRAVAEERIIVAQDLDFGNLLASSQGKLTSVVLFRTASGRPSVQIGLLEKNLPRLESQLLPGSIVVITETAIRIRRVRTG